MYIYILGFVGLLRFVVCYLFSDWQISSLLSFQILLLLHFVFSLLMVLQSHIGHSFSLLHIYSSHFCFTDNFVTYTCKNNFIFEDKCLLIVFFLSNS